MCVYASRCFEEEKERSSAIGRWRKQSHLGTLDLVLVLNARRSVKKKKRDRETEKGCVWGAE